LIVFDWTSFRRWATLLLALNTALLVAAVAVIFLYLEPVSLLTLAIAMILLIALRLGMMKRRSLLLNQATSISPAPPLAWCEYWSHFLAILMVGSAAVVFSNGLMRTLLIFICAFVVAMLFLPICNLLVGRKIRIDKLC